MNLGSKLFSLWLYELLSHFKSSYISHIKSNEITHLSPNSLLKVINGFEQVVYAGITRNLSLFCATISIEYELFVLWSIPNILEGCSAIFMYY